MKTTMKILPLMLGIMLFFTQCEKEALDTANTNAETVMDLKDGDCTVVQTLWAGAGQNNNDNGIDVGTVTATVVGNTLYVDYNVTNGWTGVEYHLWVGKRIKDIPKNAAPGRFPFSGEESYEIDLSELGINYPDDPVYIAAHAVVSQGAGLEGLESMLPENVTFSIVLNEETSYLTTTVTNGSLLDGVYDSYCINPQIQIFENTNYTGNVYSSITPPDGLVVNVDNFNQVNWIINSITVGDVYSYGDVQVAIWKLLFGSWTSNVGNTNVVNDSDPANVQEILDLAGENENFVPGCGEYLVIILWDQSVQPVIIWKPVPCGGDETAWAFGEYTFIGEKVARKWGWIFELTCD
jgi:hypothetical protein